MLSFFVNNKFITMKSEALSVIQLCSNYRSNIHVTQGNWNSDITHGNIGTMLIIKGILQVHTCVVYQVNPAEVV